MNKNATIVLSGGGARGFAHIGAIEEIERRGFIITSIAGTSMGALIGGVYAAGKMSEFKQWAHSLSKQKILKLLDFSFSTQGLIKGDKVLNTMKGFIPDCRIEDLDLKYTATAFDLINNKEVVLNRGSLYEAIRASISIPTVFTPVIKADAILVDGGVVNNIPIRNAIRTEGDTLIVINVNADIPVNNKFVINNSKKDIPGGIIRRIPGSRNNSCKSIAVDKRIRLDYFNLINATIAAAANYMSNITIQSYPPDILVEISHKSCGTFDFYRAVELVEIGRYSTQQKLNSLDNNS